MDTNQPDSDRDSNIESLDTEQLIDKLLKQNDHYQKQLESMQILCQQQEDSLSTAMILTLRSKDEQINRLEQNHSQEIASYKQLIQEAVDAAIEQCNSDWQVRFTLMEDENRYLMSMAADIKGKLKQEIREKDSTVNINGSKNDRNEECSKLKSLIGQLECEIDSLKAQLASAHRRLTAANLESTFDESQDDDRLTEMPSDLSNAMQEAKQVMDFAEQLECLKIEIGLEKERREAVEHRLNETSLNEMERVATRQKATEQIDSKLSELELKLEQLCHHTEEFLSNLSIQRSLENRSLKDDITQGQQVNEWPGQFGEFNSKELTFPNHLNSETFRVFEEDLLLTRTIESDYQRLLERNLRLETECNGLRKQLEVCQQATAKTINTIRSEINRRFKFTPII